MSYSGSLYKFASGDRSGVFFGLNMTQGIALVIPLFISLVFRSLGARFWVLLMPMWATLIPLAWGRYRGRYLSEWVVTIIRWIFVRRWPRWWTEEPWDGVNGEVPAVLKSIRIEDHDMEGRRVGVVWDDLEFSAAVVLKLRGRDFGTLTPEEQDGLLLSFARALGFAAGEGSPVKRFSWTQRSFRQSLDMHLRFVEDQRGRVDLELRNRYHELVETVGKETVRHETFLTVVVEQSVAGKRETDGFRGSSDEDRVSRIVAVLDKQARMVEQFAQESGIVVEGRLTKQDIATTMQEAIDPSRALGRTTDRGRVEFKVLKDRRCGPVQTNLAWSHLQTDGGWHRSWRITEWPRVPVRASWAPSLLARATAARTTTVVFEPVPAARSARAIERGLTKLDTDERVSAELQRRVKSSALRARKELEQRDDELASGFVELRYHGVVTVSAPSHDELVRASEEWEAAASTSMLVVAPCDGEQDLGWSGSLLLCRGSVRALGA